MLFCFYLYTKHYLKLHIRGYAGISMGISMSMGIPIFTHAHMYTHMNGMDWFWNE